jgi:hypothetical protein
MTSIVGNGKDKEFLVDQFLLEVGEGRMPAEGSPERVAYLEWRVSDDAERTWRRERLADLRQLCCGGGTE